jgi:hypothetical protein
MAKEKAAERKLPRSKMPGTTYPIVIDLPTGVYLGIGSVVQAHAILETALQELVFDLMKVEYPAGRVALRYQAGGERFKTIRRMLDLHGITTKFDTVQLLKDIRECCDHRDQFAHGVWIRDENGIMALRLTRGVFETPEGNADRTFLPEATLIPDEAYAVIRENILSTVRRVYDLSLRCWHFLQNSPDNPQCGSP